MGSKTKKVFWVALISTGLLAAPQQKVFPQAHTVEYRTARRGMGSINQTEMYILGVANGLMEGISRTATHL